MNIYLIIILAALILEFVLRSIVRYLNLKALKTKLPDEFKGFYDEEKYKRSQEYTRANARFAYVISTVDIVLIVVFILVGGFNYVDVFVRGFDLFPILTGLLFFGALYFAQDVISIPFSLYNIFVIEERFGFNKMTVRTFVLDKVKGYFLVLVFGSIVFGGILFFFEWTGEYAWLCAPMFNKFSPLEDSVLREGIEDYAEGVGFPIKEIAVMDGSKRSGHSNAYFSGIGKKRVALFDTLIERHSVKELVSIIAHEVGHYKRWHVVKRMVISVVHVGVLFFLLSLFVNNEGLFEAFKMEHISVL
jgi:STE24 endopeptidase